MLRIAETLRGDIQAKAAWSDHGRWSIYTPELGWERRPGFNGITDLDGIARSFDAEGFFSVDSKKIADRTKPKVLFIGDSNTFGFGVTPASSFAEVANAALPDIDSINLGVAGYTSAQGVKVLDKYLQRFKPAAIVVSFNANDRREVYEDDEPDSDRRFRKIYQGENGALTGFRNALEPLRVYRAFRAVLLRAGALPPAVRPFRIDQLRPRVDEKHYRANLARMAALARSNGIPAVFIVLRDNPLQAISLRKGVELANAGHYDEALEYLKPLATHLSSFTDLARVWLAKVLAAKGDSAAASRVLVSTWRNWSLHGGPPGRLDTAYNDIMRQVARENGAEIIEAADALDADPYVYIDTIHFNAIGHRRVARLVATRLAQVLHVSANVPSGTASR